jgi:hypothetical protein
VWTYHILLMVSPNLLIVPRTYGANISIGHQIKLKICGPFPRESAEKKLTQISAEKARRLINLLSASWPTY